MGNQFPVRKQPEFLTPQALQRFEAVTAREMLSGIIFHAWKISPETLECGRWWEEFCVRSTQLRIHFPESAMRDQILQEVSSLKKAILVYRHIQATGECPISGAAKLIFIREMITPRIICLSILVEKL
jgi:hypothetical protein